MQYDEIALYLVTFSSAEGKEEAMRCIVAYYVKLAHHGLLYIWFSEENMLCPLVVIH